MSFRKQVLLALAAFVTFIGLLAGLVFLIPPSHSEVTLKVTQPFWAGATLDAQPRVQIQIIDGAGMFEAGDPLQLEYVWETCANCHGSVWADQGEAMRKADIAVANMFRQDHCYKVLVRKYSGPHVIGNPIVQFSANEGGAVEISCP